MSKSEKLPGRNQMKCRIAPGIWEDMDGNIHWSITELLRMVDLPDTPGNREKVTGMLREMMQRQRPDVKIIYREKPD